MAIKRRNLLIAALAGAGAAAGVVAGLSKFRVEPATDTVVEQLFNQNYPDANGARTSLGAYRGKVLVVNFWATWCAPCVEEMPELSEIQKATTARGVQVLGLAVDSATKVREFNARLQVLYPLLVLDGAGIEVARAFGNTSGALPYTVVVDRDGRIVDQTLGRIKKDRLMRVIERTLHDA